MNMVELEADEFALQKTLLFAQVGVPGSGAVRYAAAMYFYNQNKLSVEMLEIYRRCCKFDLEDPIDLAKFEEISSIPSSGLKP
jgi:hypothetical protein